METIYGHVEIRGSGPRYSDVEVHDTEGNLIGTTTSNGCGSWRLAPVALPPGRHVVHATMRNFNGEFFASDDINIHVGDPANEVLVEAEQLDPDTVQAMQELEAEEAAAAQRAHAATHYLEYVSQQAQGYEVGSGLNDILMLLGRSHHQFCDDAAQERTTQKSFVWQLLVSSWNAMTSGSFGNPPARLKPNLGWTLKLRSVHRSAPCRWRPTSYKRPKRRILQPRAVSGPCPPRRALVNTRGTTIASPTTNLIGLR